MAGKKSPCNDFIVFLIILIINIIFYHDHRNGREKGFVQWFPHQSKLFKAWILLQPAHHPILITFHSRFCHFDIFEQFTLYHIHRLNCLHIYKKNVYNSTIFLHFKTLFIILPYLSEEVDTEQGEEDDWKIENLNIFTVKLSLACDDRVFKIKKFSLMN